MVECQLKPGGIRNYRVTKQMSSVPREAFISGTSRDLAYADLQLQCAAGEASRTMLTPIALALLIELADIQANDVVLDIAGGTGYSAAVLAGLASTVIALEDDEAFNEKAGAIWQDLGIDNAVAVAGAFTERVRQNMSRAERIELLLGHAEDLTEPDFISRDARPPRIRAEQPMT